MEHPHLDRAGLDPEAPDYRERLIEAMGEQVRALVEKGVSVDLIATATNLDRSTIEWIRDSA